MPGAVAMPGEPGLADCAMPCVWIGPVVWAGKAVRSIWAKAANVWITGAGASGLACIPEAGVQSEALAGPELFGRPFAASGLNAVASGRTDNRPRAAATVSPSAPRKLDWAEDAGEVAWPGNGKFAGRAELPAGPCARGDCAASGRVGGASIGALFRPGVREAAAESANCWGLIARGVSKAT